jgi:hypothetical protein
MPTHFSMPSMKPPHRRSSGTAGPGGRGWRVRFHREPAKIIAGHDQDDATFRPTLRELVHALSTNPKQFAKKHGKLAECRAVNMTFAGTVAWRAVFVIDEPTRLVNVLALGPHDTAYADAIRRR